MKSIGRPVAEIWPFEIFQDGGLGLGPTGSWSIGSAVPENPTLASNTKSVGQPVAEIWPFEIFQPAAILDLVKPEIAPFDPPSPKTLH